jgi:hypothetical protein
MNNRIVGFVLALAMGVGLCTYGLFFHTQTVYDNANEQDDFESVRDKLEVRPVGELTLTGWMAVERLVRNEEGYLVDLKTEAPCFS